MGEVPSHRRWVYDRCYSGRRGLKETFVIGVEQFILLDNINIMLLREGLDVLALSANVLIF